jgi:hypothetical protein
MRTLTMREETRLEIIQRVFRAEINDRERVVGAGSQRAAVLPDQGAGKATTSEGSGARESGSGV